MNVLVLMAGPSEAFRKAGYNYPKALIEVDGQAMVEHVVVRLMALTAGMPNARMIFVVRRDENIAFHLGSVIKLLVPDAVVVEAAGDTAGAACTALLGVEHINNDIPLIITNGDQLIDSDLLSCVRSFSERRLDGGIIVFKSVHPRWSFVRIDENGHVVEAAEKKPISRLATAGFYYFARGADFVRGAYSAIRKSASADGTYFVCPVYNQLILSGARIGVTEIDPQAYHSLATPSLMEAYEALCNRGRDPRP